jgi:Domain of unknown function (DUF4390)
MAFFTLCCTKLRRYQASGCVLTSAGHHLTLCERTLSEKLLLVLRYVCLVMSFFAATHSYAADPADIRALKVEKADDGLYLSATINFELPPVVEEALLKGVPVSFVSEAEVYRDRWYWYDKRVATASRNVRLAFQPLTRRWRISVVSGTVSSPASGIALTQNYESLNEALVTIRRIASWKIADNADIDVSARHNIEYRFKLDLSQLPRPLQIGVAGQSDWNISAERTTRPELR